MDFDWTPEQNEHYEGTLKFARVALEGRRKESPITREEWERCGEFGLLGLCVPTAYGGMGLDTLTTARVIEALGRGCSDMGVVFAISAHLFATVMPIVEFGTEELKEAVVPHLCSGRWIGCNAITEGNAGSDVFSLGTRATREGDAYVLEGTKSYATNGPSADVFVVYATTNPKHGYLGITGFVVERETPGLRTGAPMPTMGLRAAPACAVMLDGARVPAHRRIGDEGRGGSVFQASMQWERSCLFAAYIGMMERQLERSIAYASERRQFGRTLGSNQAISHRVVDMKIRLEAARSALYRACWLRDRGREAVVEVSIAKLMISEAAKQSSLDTIQIHGASGFTTELGVEQTLRDAVPSTIFSGTSEMQRDIIARELGL
ncbi:MAG: acyl-CoA dehydrogenase family protein [Myxococcota bacterium]